MTANAFIIEELTGTQRIISLQDRALPYRPATWGVRQRTKRTWYPGNPQATQQVLGPEEDDGRFTGMWKDRFLSGAFLVEQNGELTFPAFAREAIELLEDVARAGNTVRLQWAGIVRTGILIHFSAKYQRLGDIAWEMEFEWASRNDEVFPRAALEPVGEQEVRTTLNAVDDVAAFEPPSVEPDFTAQLVTSINEFRERASAVFDGVREVRETAEIPAIVLGAVITAVEEIRSEATEEIVALVEVPVTTVTAANRAADVFAIEGWRRSNARVISAFRASSIATARELERTALPLGVQVVIIPAASTLFKLSNRFYSTPDLAGFLADVNELDSFSIPAGTRLRIPPRPDKAARRIDV